MTSSSQTRCCRTRWRPATVSDPSSSPRRTRGGEWRTPRGRELGILRAYNTMRGQEGFWSEKQCDAAVGRGAEPVLARRRSRHHDRVPADAGRQPERRRLLLHRTCDACRSCSTEPSRTLSPMTGAPALSSEALVVSARRADPGLPAGSPPHPRAVRLGGVVRRRPPRSRGHGNVRPSGVAAGGVPGRARCSTRSAIPPHRSPPTSAATS